MPPRSRGAYRRLARQFREAALRAIDDEHDDLQRLDRLVRSEAIGVPEAQNVLRDVIRRQHERQAA